VCLKLVLILFNFCAELFEEDKGSPLSDKLELPKLISSDCAPPRLFGVVLPATKKYIF